jgi:heme-degrading monooxygenase HmoA
MPFVKHIEGTFREGKIEEGIKVVDHYNELSDKWKGFRGFINSGSVEDSKVFNMYVWETKEDMDNYYANDKEYASFPESLRPLIEHTIENKDYEVFGFNINK